MARLRDQPANVTGRFAEHVVPGIAAGGEAVVRLRMRLEELVALKVAYADVSGRSYTTEASWDQRLGRFTRTVVNDGDGVRVPVTIDLTTPNAKHVGPLGAAPAQLTLRAWLSPNPRLSRPDQAIVANWLARTRAQRRPPDQHP